jgi:hypothetical protein
MGDGMVGPSPPAKEEGADESERRLPMEIRARA